MGIGGCQFFYLSDNAGDLYIAGSGLLLEFVEIIEGQRMNADMGVDDELFAGQADTVIGYLRFLEGLFRNTHIHHDLGLGPWDSRVINSIDTKGESAFIDISRFTLGAGDGHLLSGLETFGAVFRADQAGNAQLPGDNGGMTGPSASVGDNGPGTFHNRLPVRVRHVGDQYFPGPEIVDARDITDDAGDALTDFGAHSLTAGQDLPSFLKHVSLADGL